jgi:hypothetical protein
LSLRMTCCLGRLTPPIWSTTRCYSRDTPNKIWQLCVHWAYQLWWGRLLSQEG